MSENELNSIEKQIAELQQKKQAILESKRSEALDDVRTKIRQFGFSAADVGLKKDGKSIAPPRAEAKYANPADASQTWPGGKGAKPKWAKAWIAAGKDIELCRIQK